MQELAKLVDKLSTNQNDVDALSALGDLHIERDKPSVAVEYYERAVRLRPYSPRELYVLSTLYEQLGREDLALDRAQEARRAAPNWDKAFFQLAKLTARSGTLHTTERLIASQKWPLVSAQTIGQLAYELLCVHSADVAWLTLQRSFPSIPSVSLQVGVTDGLIRHGRFHEAEVLIAQMATATQESHQVLSHRAQLRCVEGDLLAGIQLHYRAIQQGAVDGRSLLFCWADLMRSLRFEEARGLLFRHEARFRSTFGRYDLGKGLDYGRILSASRVLLHCDRRWGLGDAIQFVRAAKRLNSAGTEVILLCRTPLQRVFSNLPFVSRAISPGDAIPDHDGELSLFEAWALLEACDGETSSYIPKSIQSHAATRTEGQLRVALTWRGSAAGIGVHLMERSLPLEFLSPLARAGNLKLYAVQFDASLAEKELNFVDWSENPVGDLLESCRVLSSMDAVVSVDTAVAHLAGALGIPCVVLLPHLSCWHWGPSSLTRSTWYDSLFLTRQDKSGSWLSALGGAAQFLVTLQECCSHQPKSGANAHV